MFRFVVTADATTTTRHVADGDDDDDDDDDQRRQSDRMQQNDLFESSQTGLSPGGTRPGDFTHGY